MSDRFNHIIDKFSNLPAQGSVEWHKHRKYGIGASELATYLDINKSVTIKKGLSEKVGLREPTPSTEPCFIWGHFWEPIHRIIIQKLLNIKDSEMKEMGAIPYGEDKYTSKFKNSPDGIFIVDKQKLESVFGKKEVDELEIDYIDKDGKVFGILELKAPIGRTPYGFIPEYYLPQVLSNMCVVQNASFGLFSEMVVKRCSQVDVYGGGNYTPSVGYGNTIMNSDELLYNGCVYVYASEPYRTKLRSLVLKKNAASDELCDFGSCLSDQFFYMIALWRQMDIYNLDPSNIDQSAVDEVEVVSDLDISDDEDIDREIHKSFVEFCKIANQIDKDEKIDENDRVKLLPKSYKTLKYSPIQLKYVVNIKPNMISDHELLEDEIKLYDSVPEEIGNKRLTGFCSWKCFHMSFHLAKKQHKYIYTIWPVIKLTIKSFKYIKHSASDKEKGKRVVICSKLIKNQADIVKSNLIKL